MKLEPELIKKILEFGEENLPDKIEYISTEKLEINGFSREQIIFHLNLLWKNGYVECGFPVLNFEDIHFKQLTWNGYQYLSLLKSNAWNSAKKMMKDVGIIFVESAIRAVIDKVNP